MASTMSKLALGSSQVGIGCPSLECQLSGTCSSLIQFENKCHTFRHSNSKYELEALEVNGLGL